MTKLNKIIKRKAPVANNIFRRLDEIQGVIRTVATAPTWTPTKLSEQFAIYNTGGVFRFYWYDTTNAEWRFVVGT